MPKNPKFKGRAMREIEICLDDGNGSFGAIWTSDRIDDSLIFSKSCYIRVTNEHRCRPGIELNYTVIDWRKFFEGKFICTECGQRIKEVTEIAFVWDSPL